MYAGFRASSTRGVDGASIASVTLGLAFGDDVVFVGAAASASFCKSAALASLE